MPIKVVIAPSRRAVIEVRVKRPSWQQYLHY